jgi:hypothetical protein
MTATLVISDHSQLGGLTTGDDHTQYFYLPGRAGGQTAIGGTLTTQGIIFQDNVADGNQMTWGPGINSPANALLDLQTGLNDIEIRHMGLGVQAATNTHIMIGDDSFPGQTSGSMVGIGMFPRFTPTVSAANTLYAIQGNAWFGGTNWGAGSNVICLWFVPANIFPASIGSANLNLTGISTGGLVNILGQTVTADVIQGILITPIGNLFGTDASVANIVRGLIVTDIAGSTGTFGRQTGIEVDKQTYGTVNHGIWLHDDGIGADLSLGAGVGVNPDARMYYDGTNLIIDPNVLGTGRVYIGITGNDTLRLTTLEFGADVSLTRGAANRLDLASGDTLRLVTGPLQFAGASEQISRTAGELLLTATNVRTSAKLEIDGALDHDGSTAGFYGTAPAAKPAALTAALTQITHTGPTTPDYSIATPVDSGVGSAWGFSTQDEFETAMSVILNLQTRLDQLESRLQGIGLLT